MFDVFDHISSGSMSPKEFDELQGHIAEIQRRGLRFVQQHLDKQLPGGNDHKQVTSDTDIDSDYDFVIMETRFVGVKSTEGSFDKPIHFSYNELLQMREASNYELYRVYEISETQALLRVAQEVKRIAESILSSLEKLPEGVRPDSVSVSPGILDFGEPITLTISDQDE